MFCGGSAVLCQLTLSARWLRMGEPILKVYRKMAKGCFIDCLDISFRPDGTNRPGLTGSALTGSNINPAVLSKRHRVNVCVSSGCRGVV